MEEKYCPNCGRYVGSLEKCPYCGAKIPKHTSYYYAKYGSLTFAIFGIIFLLIFSQSMPVQYVQIKDITQTYNYATIKIKGIVSSSPSLVTYKEGSKTMYIDVDDGTGVMSLHIYSPVVERMAKSRKIPGYGDFVNIIGEVYFRGDNRYMIVNDPAQVEIHRAKAVAMNIADINGIEFPNGKYVRVTINASVVSIKSTTSGSYVLNVTDGTGFIDVYIPSYITELYSMDVEHLKGDYLEISGSIEWYGTEMSGEWEIIPSSPDDIMVI